MDSLRRCNQSRNSAIWGLPSWHGPASPKAWWPWAHLLQAKQPRASYQIQLHPRSNVLNSKLTNVQDRLFLRILRQGDKFSFYMFLSVSMSCFAGPWMSRGMFWGRRWLKVFWKPMPSGVQNQGHTCSMNPFRPGSWNPKTFSAHKNHGKIPPKKKTNQDPSDDLLFYGVPNLPPTRLAAIQSST